jgi:hypothetical protein
MIPLIEQKPIVLLCEVEIPWGKVLHPDTSATSCSTAPKNEAKSTRNEENVRNG